MYSADYLKNVLMTAFAATSASLLAAQAKFRWLEKAEISRQTAKGVFLNKYEPDCHSCSRRFRNRLGYFSTGKVY